MSHLQLKFFESARYFIVWSLPKAEYCMWHKKLLSDQLFVKLRLIVEGISKNGVLDVWFDSICQFNWPG